MKYDDRSAAFATELAADSDNLTLVLTSQSGDTDKRTVPRAELANVSIRVQDGNVIWSAVR